MKRRSALVLFASVGLLGSLGCESQDQTATATPQWSELDPNGEIQWNEPVMLAGGDTFGRSVFAGDSFSTSGNTALAEVDPASEMILH